MRYSLAVLTAAFTLGAGLAVSQTSNVSFFVTSKGLGNGGDLGGLAGADAHCAALAEAAGITGRTWAAYLSTSTVDARDRIGPGPWHNVKGELIAGSVELLHSAESKLDKLTALDETGAVISGRGDTPNRHDILTGSNADGTRAPETCNDWTSSAADATGIVGHHDRMGPETLPTGTSWNAAHATRGGCGVAALESTGGDGLFYCFATD